MIDLKEYIDFGFFIIMRCIFIYFILFYHRKVWFAFAGEDGRLDTTELSKAVIVGLTIFIVWALVYVATFKDTTVLWALLAGLFSLAGLPFLKNWFNKNKKDEPDKTN